MGRRGQNEESIYKRKDGRWAGTVSLGYRNGKRWRKSVYGSTRREVREKLDSVLRANESGLPVTPARQTVGDFLTDWLESCAKPTVRPATFVRYRQHIDQRIIPGIGHVKLAKLSPQQVQKLENDMLKDGLAPATVRYAHAVLRRALRQAERWGLVSRNVAALVDPPRAQKSEVIPLDEEQARKFLATIQGNRLEALYTVALALGLRKGEALGLQWSDLDLENASLSVRNSLQRIEGKLTLVEPKSKQSRRTIALPDIAVEALRRHKVRQTEERLVAGSAWQDEGFVFTTGIGTPIDTRNLTRHFEKALTKAGLPRKRFHDLRHTCASLLLAQGVHPRVVMEILGHSQISLTMDTYSHVVPELQRAAVSQYGDLLSSTLTR